MAVGDCYEATIFGNYGTLKPLNSVFHYVQTDGVAGGSQALAEYLKANLLPEIKAIATTFCNWSRIRVKNLFASTDFYDLSFLAENGSIAGDTLPPDCAASFTFPTLNLAINAGGKRFGGLPETCQSNGTITEAAQITRLLALGTEIITPIAISTPLIRNFSFCIVKRIKFTEGTPPKTKYRLPQNVGEFVYYVPSQYIHHLAVGSQDSRRL